MRAIQSFLQSIYVEAHYPMGGKLGGRTAFRLRSVVIILIFGLALPVAVSLTSLAAAQSETPQPGGAISDDQVNAIAKEMFCPVCENTPLDVCPTQACIEWRELIREMLAEGKTETEIKAYFVSRFGDRVLAEPPRTGMNWLIYILPPIIMLAGAALLFGVFRGYRKPAPQPAIGGSASGEVKAQDEYVQRLEEELRKQ